MITYESLMEYDVILSLINFMSKPIPLEAESIDNVINYLKDYKDDKNENFLYEYEELFIDQAITFLVNSMETSDRLLGYDESAEESA